MLAITVNNLQKSRYGPQIHVCNNCWKSGGILPGCRGVFLLKLREITKMTESAATLQRRA
jgi:hypothetical protein